MNKNHSNLSLSTLFIIVLLIIIWALFELNKSTEGYVYGNSFRQNNQVNTIRLHRYGITGRNITIGIIDAGFNAKHSVFDKTRILKEFDFVTNKSTTLNQSHIKGVDHGTNVFSMVGGYKKNELIGIAYGADFILAKTDISGDRLAEEEDYAVKASGWLSNNGANIITTSLSFNKFDNADHYSPSQMNGKTAKITRTADSLADKGVLYVCSAGNNYEKEWRIVEPPADGFKVLAAGSVNKKLDHSFFSSCGPTTDGRTKPEIVTPGEGVWVANYLPGIKSEFGWSHGTSLSAPIAAGIAALVLSVHPDLTPDELVEIIKKTSSKADMPDNLYGWGLPDAEKAVSYAGPAFSNVPELFLSENKLEIKTYVFSSYGLISSKVKLYISDNEGDVESVYQMEENGENHYIVLVENLSNEKEIKFYFKAEDSRKISVKYPRGILGEYFIFNKANEELRIIKKR